jgi:hypothetical protein
VTYSIEDVQILTAVKISKIWESILSLIAGITNDAQFEADLTGMTFRSKDQTREAFLDIFIPKAAFQHFYCPRLIRFGILAKDLLSVVGRFNPNNPIQLFIKDRFLVVTSNDSSGRNYKLNLIESKPLVSSLREIAFSTKLIMKTEMLAAILDDIKVLSGKLALNTIHGKRNTTTFGSTSDIGLALVTISQKQEDPNIILHSTNLEKCQSSYSIGTLSQLVNLIVKSCEFVELEYCNEGPLRLKFMLFGNIPIQLFLAPQFEI